MTALRQYQYPKLVGNDNFRLFHLLPVPENSRLQCFMLEVPKNDLPKYSYYALSYTWGSPTDKVPIRCGDSVVMIPRNLYLALHCLAREPWQNAIDTHEPIGYSIWIWADAICIHQSDQDEKSQQVPLMRQIYQSADAVLVWLGELVEADRDLIQLVSKLHKSLVRATAGRDPKSIDIIALRDSGIIAHPTSEDWKRLGDFYREPWFSRKWIIQEVASANKIAIMKGPLVIPADAVFQLPKLLIDTNLVSVVKTAQFENAQLRNTPLDCKLNGILHANFMSVARMKLRSKNPWTLLELLCKFRDSLATDAKDHIFALVGISSDGGHPAYRVDYKREIAEIYRSFAWTTITQHSSLRILSSAGLQNGTVDLPSWVPDWAVAPQVRAYDVVYPGAFQASGATSMMITHDLDDVTQPAFYQNVFAMLKASLKSRFLPTVVPTPGIACLSKNNTVLNVLGKIIDTVENLGTTQTPDEIIPVLDDDPAIPGWVRSKWTKGELQTFWSGMLFGEATRAEAETLTHALSSYPNYIAGGTIDDALWRTLICNTTFTGERIPDTYHDNFLSWRAFKTILLSTEDHFDAVISEHFGRAKIFDQVYISAIMGKRFFTTQGGFIGLAPSRTVRGDLVCVLKGATVPFILRQTDKGYVLVGECYCHGIMYGEAMQKRDLEMREFSII